MPELVPPSGLFQYTFIKIMVYSGVYIVKLSSIVYLEVAESRSDVYSPYKKSYLCEIIDGLIVLILKIIPLCTCTY